MKHYSIEWDDVSGMFGSTLTGRRSYFVGDFLEEIAVLEGIDTEDVISESHLLAILNSKGITVTLVDMNTKQDIGWDF